MISCKDSIHALLDFLDGDMSPEDEKRLEEHFSACPPCVAFVRSYRATPGLCKKALARKMPEEVATKLSEFIRSNIRK